MSKIAEAEEFKKWVRVFKIFRLLARCIVYIYTGNVCTQEMYIYIYTVLSV